MNIYKLNRETYDRIACDWNRDHSNDTWWIPATDRFLALLPKGGRILDVGCGAGTKSAYMVQKGFHVVGIDFSQAMIDIAQTRRLPPSQAEFLRGDMRLISLLDRGMFDGIFMQAVLLHAQKSHVRMILAEVAKLLLPDGGVYVAVKKMQGDLHQETRTENDYGYDYRRFFTYYSLEEVTNHFEAVGIEIKEAIEDPAGTKWIQVFGTKRK